MKHALQILLVSVMAAVLAGCGIDDPYNDPGQGSASAQPAEAAHSHDEDVPDTSDPTTAVSADAPGNAGAEEVAIAYGLAQTNWSAATYEQQYERMTDLAGGKLADDLASSRPEADQLQGIKETRQINRSQVVAVDTRKSTGSEAVIVVVYRENAGSGGVLDPVPHHTVHQATVRKTDATWRVVKWSSLQG